MLEFLGELFRFIHIIAGASTLVTGPIAIFYNFRDPRKHRIVGKAFYYAMLVVVVSAILGFFKHPDKVFFQFLLGLSLLVAGPVPIGTGWDFPWGTQYFSDERRLS